MLLTAGLSVIKQVLDHRMPPLGMRAKQRIREIFEDKVRASSPANAAE